MAIAPRSTNRLLADLTPEDFELLRPHLRPMEMQRGTLLAEGGALAPYAFFPLSGIISLVIVLTAGETVEIAMLGRDSICGTTAALAGGISLNDAVVLFSGTAMVMDRAPLRAAADRSATLRVTLMRHVQGLLIQAQQSVACNTFHRVDARLSRWLLRMRELSGSDTLPVTQEFLGQMIGVRRNSVSLVAATLQKAGLIRYRRGVIEILDVAGLKDTACECYETVNRYYAALLGSG
jgi:CRP-like cAMP-binding protein